MKRKLLVSIGSPSFIARCKGFALSLVALLLLPGCGPEGAPPGIPEATVEYGQGTGDLETDEPGEDNPSEPLVKDGDQANNNEEGEGEGEGSNGQDPIASPTDGLRATRLQGLPSSIATEVTQCEKEGRFFSLGDKTCTEEKPSSFPCRIDDAFNGLIDPATSERLASYISTQVKDLQLYGCTDNKKNITLHFFRFADNTIVYRKLLVPRLLKDLTKKD